MIDFKKELAERTAAIDTIVNSYLPEASGEAEYIKSAMDYSVQAGGKRVRPMIMLETYRLCGGTDESCVYPFMAALEMIHTYSLVHDDLPAMDNDDYRRGKLTTQRLYGAEEDGLQIERIHQRTGKEYQPSYWYFSGYPADYKNPDTAEKMALYSRAAAVIAGKAGVDGMVGGQSLDVYLTDKPMDEAQLDYIFRLKTGALIEAAFMAGGILAGCDDTTEELLCKAGYNVGFAFQIKDDILDVTSTQEVLGKPVLSDERNNKTTYVTLYGFEKAEKDTYDMSKEALDVVKSIGHNEYLEELIDMLIHRNK